MYQVRLEQFEGPLDLLLKLCQEEKLSLSKISLAKIADAYCEEVTRATAVIPMGELVDFLLVAAQLLLIKSRLLLPGLFQEEEEPMPDLEQKLKVYRAYLGAMENIDNLLGREKYAFFRQGPPHGWENFFKEPVIFVSARQISIPELHLLFKKLLAGLLKVSAKLPTDAISRVATLEEKIKALREWLSGRLEGRFSEVAPLGASKIDIILYFLAILELAKQRHVSLEQEEMWGEIIIRKDAEVASSSI